MAITDGENGFNVSMPVAPAYNGCNNNGFGNDWGWIILLLLFANGGWGNGYGGFGGNQLGYDFPWLLNGQNGINANTNAGFDHAATQTALGDLSTAVTSGFGNVQTALCGGFAGVNATVNGAQNAISQQLYTNQLADLNRSFDSQTAITQGMNTIANGLQNCCCENRAGLADLKYTVATENCADRAALSDGIRDLLAATQAQTQTILTQMCNDKIESKNDTISQLRQELLYARGQASQDVQTARILAGQVAETDAIYSRLNTCPVPSVPVYGDQRIFSCNNNNCGCGI